MKSSQSCNPRHMRVFITHKTAIRCARSCFVFAALMAGLAIAQAHEFWLQPDRYFLKTGEKLRMKFLVGENFMGEPWDLNVHHIESLNCIENEATRNLKDSIDMVTAMLSLRFTHSGTKLLAMES